MPHLDYTARTERSLAAELSDEARDRMENEARIRERLEADPPRRCDGCGNPFSALNADGNCHLCVRDKWINWANEKLSDDEIYPTEED